MCDSGFNTTIANTDGGAAGFTTAYLMVRAVQPGPHTPRALRRSSCQVTRARSLNRVDQRVALSTSATMRAAESHHTGGLAGNAIVPTWVS